VSMSMTMTIFMFMSGPWTMRSRDAGNGQGHAAHIALCPAKASGAPCTQHALRRETSTIDGSLVEVVKAR